MYGTRIPLKLLIFILLLLGCANNSTYIQTKLSSSSTEINVYVDKDFDPIDDEQILEGITQWNYVLNDFIYLNIVDWNYDAWHEKQIEKPMGDGFYVVKIFSDGKISSPDAYLAFADDIGGQIIYIVLDRVKPETIQFLILHEIGHLLGAKHQGFFLMHPFYNQNRYKCIDEGVVRQVGTYLNLDWTMLKWCVNGKYY